MIVERAVKANRKVVNQGLLISLDGRKLPIMISDPHNLVATGSFGGLSLQTNLQQYQLVEFLSNFQNVRPPQKAPIDDFLSTVLDSQFVRFLPRRIEDSATVIWVHLYTQCDFVFQRKSNV